MLRRLGRCFVSRTSQTLYVFNLYFAMLLGSGQRPRKHTEFAASGVCPLIVSSSRRVQWTNVANLKAHSSGSSWQCFSNEVATTPLVSTVTNSFFDRQYISQVRTPFLQGVCGRSPRVWHHASVLDEGTMMNFTHAHLRPKCVADTTPLWFDRSDV